MKEWENRNECVIREAKTWAQLSRNYANKEVEANTRVEREKVRQFYNGEN